MIKYNLFFTLDYEIHGNGDGNPYALMVEPTYKLMSLLESYGQRLIIMADVAEILCFRRYWQETGKDDFHVADIERQLCDAILRGHDVQLHIHSSYLRQYGMGRLTNVLKSTIWRICLMSELKKWWGNVLIIWKILSVQLNLIIKYGCFVLPIGA